MSRDPWDTATAVLRLATSLVHGIQHGLADRGFVDVRPVHGFAFARLAGALSTTPQLAEHLGITKRPASLSSTSSRAATSAGRRTRTTDAHACSS